MTTRSKCANAAAECVASGAVRAKNDTMDTVVERVCRILPRVHGPAVRRGGQRPAAELRHGEGHPSETPGSAARDWEDWGDWGDWGDCVRLRAAEYGGVRLIPRSVHTCACYRILASRSRTHDGGNACRERLSVTGMQHSTTLQQAQALQTTLRASQLPRPAQPRHRRQAPSAASHEGWPA